MKIRRMFEIVLFTDIYVDYMWVIYGLHMDYNL